MSGPPPAAVPHVCVVVPAYRAARSVADVVRGVPASVRTVVVVDDGSDDGTSAAVAACGDPRVVLLRHDRNRGVGAAMATGYEEALARGADVVVKMDADGQMDPADLPRLLAPVLSGRADYAKGNRFHGPGHLQGMPAWRLVGNAGLSFLSKLSSGAWHVFDPCNGYTAIHRAALLEIDRRRIHPGFYFESSMLVLLSVARAVIEDVPMPARYGDQGSHLRIGRALTTFPLLHARHAAWRFVRTHLVQDFDAVGVLVLAGLPALLFGVIDGLAVWLRSAATGVPATTGTVMIPTLATILGFQMLLHALLLDVASVPRRPLQSVDRAGTERGSA